MPRGSKCGGLAVSVGVLAWVTSMMGVAAVSRSRRSLGTSTLGGNRGKRWLRRACLEPTELTWFPVALVGLCCGWRLEKYFCCCYWSLVVPALLQLGRVGILVDVGVWCCCPSYPPLGCDVGVAPQPLHCYCLCWGFRLGLSTWHQVWACSCPSPHPASLSLPIHPPSLYGCGIF